MIIFTVCPFANLPNLAQKSSQNATAVAKASNGPSFNCNVLLRLFVFVLVWQYGLAFVTLINLLSLLGIFVIPVMNKSFYSTLLMFLISLAVGTLAASSIINLIPEVGTV